MLFLSYKLDEIVSQPKGKQKSKRRMSTSEYLFTQWRTRASSCEMQIPAVDPRAQPATALPAGAGGPPFIPLKKAEKGQNQRGRQPLHSIKAISSQALPRPGLAE